MFKSSAWKIIVICCFVILCSVSLAWTEAKIKIGVQSALTGDAATFGTDIKNVIQFANRKLAQDKYELIFEDDRCNGRDAVAAAHRFIDVLKLRYVTGFACSSTILSTANLYEKAEVLTMVMSASAADVSEAGDFIFRTWASDAGAASKLYDYVALKHKKFGIITEQTDYAEGFERSFTNSHAEGEMKIVSESYLPGTSDFRSIIMKLRNSGVDGLFINSQAEAPFLAALRQIREMSWDVKIYSAYWGGTANVLEKASDLVEDSIYVDLPSVTDALTPEGQSLYQEFTKEYGGMQSVDLLFGTVYEGFRALDAAIRTNGDPKEYLYNKKFNGIIGEWSFDKNGDIQGLGFVVKTIKNGKVKVLG